MPAGENSTRHCCPEAAHSAHILSLLHLPAPLYAATAALARSTAAGSSSSSHSSCSNPLM